MRQRRTCYRAMDWLHQVRHALERQVFSQVATALDLQVDLLFFDTTSTYFGVEGEDEPVLRDKDGSPVPAAGAPGGDGQEMAGFRVFGKSKDHRDDLPQIVIGMAVTRGGIPVRIWCWPGNTADSALIRQVKHDMRDWTLAKIVWVADRGFTSQANRRYLRRGDHHYIIGEKLRSGSAEATAALSRQGRTPAFPRKRPRNCVGGLPACGLAAPNLWAGPKQGRICAGQSQT
jgi:hypothetical protein